MTASRVAYRSRLFSFYHFIYFVEIVQEKSERFAQDRAETHRNLYVVLCIMMIYMS